MNIATMTLPLSQMVSTSALQMLPPPASSPARLILRDRLGAQTSSPGAQACGDASAPVGRRTKIWEFGTTLHCSIVGTCLTTAELRHVLAKLDIEQAGAATDHELHSLAVTLAARRENGARFLQKALDRRHHVAISRYAGARGSAALLALWDESLKQGDVPGAYWAVLTHPATTEAVVKRVFGDVHMLSHLMGAANRADIRRLRQLEQENAALLAKTERQQQQLRSGFAARDQAIRRLNEMLARQVGQPSEPAAAAEPQEARDIADNLIRDLQKRLAREGARRERIERRLDEASTVLREKERALQLAREQIAAARQELEAVEAHLDASLEKRSGADGSVRLAGLVILYVGGRAHQIPRLKALVELVGGRFLHHDGGIEHGAGLLPSLVSRAGHIVFPVDCVSHDAVATIKRLCRQTGRQYQPLGTASLAALLAALSTIHHSTELVVAAE